MRRRYQMLALVLLMAPGLAGAQQITREGGRYVTTIKQTYDVKPGGRLEVDRVTGEVLVSTWAQNHVEILEVLRMDVDGEDEARRIAARALKQYELRANTVTVVGDRADRYVQRQFAVRIPVSFNVEVETRGGGIRVEGVKGRVSLTTAGGAVTVQRVEGDVEASSAGGALQFLEIRGALDANTAGGDITVEGVTGRLEAVTAGGGVTVREAGQDVLVTTAGGRLDLRDIKGALEARTAGGNIRVANVQGRVEVTTAGGEIDLQNLQRGVHAGTSGGDITGRGLQGAVEVETAAGDIVLRDVTGPVEARTSVGNIEVEVGVQGAERPRRMWLKSSYGDINLTLPARLPARIEAELSLPGGRFSRNDIFSDFPLSRDRSGSTLQSEGLINGGGDLIELRSNGGNIYIRKK